MAQRFDLEYGYALFHGNELHIVSTIEDPPKVYLATPSGLSLGTLSFGRVREDGRLVESIIFQGKQDERYRNVPKTDPRYYAGEFTIHIGSGGQDDRDMRRILEARHDGIVFDVPVTFRGGTN